MFDYVDRKILIIALSRSIFLGRKIQLQNSSCKRLFLKSLNIVLRNDMRTLTGRTCVGKRNGGLGVFDNMLRPLNFYALHFSKEFNCDLLP